MRRRPDVIFALSATTPAFVAGASGVESRLSSSQNLHDAPKAIRFMDRQLTGTPPLGNLSARAGTDGTLAGLPVERLGRLDGAASSSDGLSSDRVVRAGGLNQSPDGCPEFGGLAIEIDRDGTSLHGIPVRAADSVPAELTGVAEAGCADEAGFQTGAPWALRRRPFRDEVHSVEYVEP